MLFWSSVECLNQSKADPSNISNLLILNHSPLDLEIYIEFIHAILNTRSKRRFLFFICGFYYCSVKQQANRLQTSLFFYVMQNSHKDGIFFSCNNMTQFTGLGFSMSTQNFIQVCIFFEAQKIICCYLYFVPQLPKEWKI